MMQEFDATGRHRGRTNFGNRFRDRVYSRLAFGSGRQRSGHYSLGPGTSTGRAQRDLREGARSTFGFLEEVFPSGSPDSGPFPRNWQMHRRNPDKTLVDILKVI